MGSGKESQRQYYHKNKKKRLAVINKWIKEHPQNCRDSANRRNKKMKSKGASAHDILETHRIELKDDPERLSDEFLQQIIGSSIKKPKRIGWYEAPDESGIAPRHSQVTRANALKKTLRKAIVSK